MIRKWTWNVYLGGGYWIGTFLRIGQNWRVKNVEWKVLSFNILGHFLKGTEEFLFLLPITFHSAYHNIMALNPLCTHSPARNMIFKANTCYKKRTVWITQHLCHWSSGYITMILLNWPEFQHLFFLNKIYSLFVLVLLFCFLLPLSQFNYTLLLDNNILPQIESTLRW